MEATRDRPSEALAAAEETASEPLEANSDEDEAYLAANLRVTNCDRRSRARDAVTGMVERGRSGGKCLRGSRLYKREDRQDRRRLQAREELRFDVGNFREGHVTEILPPLTADYSMKPIYLLKSIY